ncbi:MAG TPA: CopG family ribbon-helix-helix protein [Bacillus sp. (in: firmicutes)]|nr:CopG family ribbon-helix-helix protein [Bacillus sp. (in: firmicutes)]
MTIVSISLSKDLLDDLNKLQKRLGFTGRSEIIRASVRTMLSEEKKKEDLIGDIHALFLVTHDEKSDDEINNMRHTYDKLITTHLHNKIDRDRCLEIFVLKGNANQIRGMNKLFQSNKKMDNVKLIAM